MDDHPNPHRAHPSELSASEMIRRAIHDLRNPRHVIDGLTQILLEEEAENSPGSSSTREILQDLQAQTERLEAVETDLLEWLKSQNKES